MSRADQMVRVRIPQELKAWVEQECLRQDRSRNAQFVHCLRQAKLLSEPDGDRARGVGNLDRRKPAPSNLLFELHDYVDVFKEYFLQVIDIEGSVLIAFVEDRREGPGVLHIQSFMNLDMDECMTLGKALVAAASSEAAAGQPTRA